MLVNTTIIAATHPSTKIIHSHTKRSVMVIVVMGIIFGIIFAIDLLLQGAIDSYTKFATEKSNGQTIIMATNESSSGVSRKYMIDDIKMYGGEIIGNMKVVGTYAAIILPKNLVEQYIEADIAKIPKDVTPVLVPVFIGEQLLGYKFQTTYETVAEKLKAYDDYRKNIIGKIFDGPNGEKYYVAGLSFGGFQTNSLSFDDLERGNYNILNPILETITIQPGMLVAINDGRIEASSEMPTTSDLVLAVFSDDKSIYKYFEDSKAQFPNTAFTGREYSVSIISGMSPEMSYMFNLMKIVVNIASIVLGCVAAMIVVFTSIRLVDQDRQNILLYYSLGANPRQVFVIYLCYFVEIMFGVLFFALGIALASVALFNIFNQNLINAQAILVFSLPTMPKIMWLGINLEIVTTAIIIIALAPLCVLVNKKIIDCHSNFTKSQF